MATFNEIYHSYLNGVQGIAPISGQQGITSLAKPIVPNTNDNANTNTNYSNNFNQDPNAKSMYSNYYMDNLGFGDILGGISGLASKAMGYPSLGYAVAANNNLGLDFSGFSPGEDRGMAYGASNYSGAVDTQDYGREADNVSNGGVSASEAGMGDGMSDLAKGGRAGTDGYANGGRIGYATGGILQLNDPMEKMYMDMYGFNPFPKYGFNSYMDYNTARSTGTPMNENISALEDYLGTLDTAQKFNVPVNKDLTTEGISNLISKSKGETFDTGLTPTPTSTPDYGQQALSEMLSRYNVGSLGDIKNFNYLIPGYKDKNNLEVKAFETRTPELAVNRRAQQLADVEARTQQAYQTSLQRAPTNIREHINTAVGGLNSSQRQQYMNYAVQNPDKAIAAAQQNRDFMAATQRNTTPAAMANGGRVSYLQGGIVSLLGDYYGKR
jgi:hypothetical protein